MPALSHAQTVQPLAIGSYDFNGLTINMTSCTYDVAGTGSSCAGDGTELKQVSTGRGTVTIEIIPTSGSELFSSATTGLNGVNFTFTVTTNAPSSATISSVNLTSYGTNSSGEANNFFATITGNQYSPPEIIATLAQNATSSNCSQSSGVCTITPPAGLSTLNFSGGLLLAGSTGTSLALTSAVFTFQTVPEPPLWTLFLTGLGGLAVVRRRCSPTVRKSASAEMTFGPFAPANAG